jgi:hypothetical protein
VGPSVIIIFPPPLRPVVWSLKPPLAVIVVVHCVVVHVVVPTVRPVFVTVCAYTGTPLLIIAVVTPTAPSAMVIATNIAR